MNRKLWVRRFDEKHIPVYPCPRCDHGHVVADPATLNILEPSWSKDARGHEAWDPDWIVERFSVAMLCQAVTCGEVVVMSGEAEWTDSLDEEHGWTYERMLVPKHLYPAPPIINIPDETSGEVIGPITEAYSLFWSDPGSCANKLRISVERLLDDLKVPSTDTKGGRLSLYDRIEAFKSEFPAHAPTLDALRIVGNIGSHEGDVQRQIVLDAFEIYEDALAELYGKRSERIVALRKKIAEAKGKKAGLPPTGSTA